MSQYYSATMKVPVYASWKCKHCGEANFATGRIIYRQTESAFGWRYSNYTKAQNKAVAHARAGWADCALKIIHDPKGHATEMYKHFFLPNSTCTKCGKKPHWSRSFSFYPFLTYVIPLYIICGFIFFSVLSPVAVWAFLLANVGIAIWAILRRIWGPKKISELPTAYTPVIGSLNPELVRLSKSTGQPMPTPDECIAAVRGYNQKAEADQALVAPPVAKQGNAPVIFCRKCGAKLKENRIFCHKCRTEIMRP